MRWVVATSLALVTHLALFYLLAPFLAPQAVEEEPLDLADLSFGIVALNETRAEAQKPDQEVAQETELPAEKTSISAVPQRRVETEALAEITPRVAPADGDKAAHLVPVTVTTQRLRSNEIGSDQLMPSILKTLSPPLLSGERIAVSNPSSSPQQTLPIVGPPARPVENTGTDIEAELYFAGAAQVQFDAKSLASLQTFLKPDGSASEEDPIRNGLSALLASQDCARLQTVFLPDTGTVELRGHVPSSEMRLPLMNALKDQIGSALPLRDNLLILPAPQCGVLTKVAALGLPQSDEQITNPRMVGQDTHAKEYLFTEGDRLKLELTAPSYRAYVYVDYYDADGQVIHLMPNIRSVPVAFQADQPFTVGGVESGLDIRIGPPFGQDIAIAFASSHPVFDEPRPLIEPADPYLRSLSTRIATLRDTHNDYKGEWAYLFVRTQSAGN